MSQITLNPAQTQAALNDANAPASRPQPQTAAPSTSQAPASTALPTDSVELSPAAQAPVASQATATLSDSDAQKTSANLRQQIGLYGLSASLSQNQSVLSLLRRQG
ncbi:MAG TPA: hypothetical protein VM689_02330 [Aliidongia sp.]|nr:hypothetical protein [Aliidongia sp.]